MKTLVVLLALFSLILLGSAADPAPAANSSKAPKVRTSVWDANRDGKLDANERKAMMKALGTGGGTNAFQLGRLTNSGPQKVGPQPNRLTERIQKALADNSSKAHP